MQINTLPLSIGQSSGTSFWNGTLDAGAVTPSPTPAPTPDPTPSPTGPDPVIGAAGDIACDPSDPGYNGGAGTSDRCQQRATSNLLVGAALSAVLPLGDIQYDS